MGVDTKALERVKAKQKRKIKRTKKKPIIRDISRRKRSDWEALRRTSYSKEWQIAFQSFKDKNYRDLDFCPDDPEVQRQYSQEQLIEAFMLSDEGKKLADQWGLVDAYNPDTSLWTENPDAMQPVFKDMIPVKVIPHSKARIIEKKRKKPHCSVVETREAVYLVDKTLDTSPHLRDRRFLTLEIDLSCPQKHIEEWINKYLSRYSLKVKGTRPKRGPTYDEDLAHYRVWDEHKKKRKSLLKIASEMHPDIEPFKPNEDKKARAAYEKTKRLNSKADKEIKKIEALHNNSFHHGLK